MLIVPSARRRVLVAGAALGIAALLAGCGSAAPHSAATSGATSGRAHAQQAPGRGQSASGSAAPAAPPAGPGGLVACRSDSLRVSVNAGQVGATAGSLYYPLDFTNTSRSACGMYGYPGISFVSTRGRAGQQIGAAAVRNPAFGKLAVRLPVGGVAHAWLQVAQAANYPASACRPVKVHWLRVFAPGQTVPSFVSYTFDACGSPNVSLLTVMPVRDGRGVQGKTP